MRSRGNADVHQIRLLLICRYTAVRMPRDPLKAFMPLGRRFMAVSATTVTRALAIHDPVNCAPGRAAQRTDPRFRAGIVMEALERRRVLSAAASGALALGNLSFGAGATAIVKTGSLLPGGIVQTDLPIAIDDTPTAAGDGAGDAS